MYKIIGGDGKEYGPLSSRQVIDYIEDNRANANTLARRVEDADWMPLSSFPEFSAGLSRQATTPPPLPSANQPAAAPSPLQAHNIPTYIIPAIFVNLCLCPVFALPALFYATQVNRKLAARDIPGAEEASRN